MLTACHYYPAVGSIFYLTDDGGPTVVFNQSMSYSGLRPVLPETLAIIYPRRNRLAVFKGNLFHGVLKCESQFVRATLLVNYWRNKTAGDPPPSPIAIDQHLMKYSAKLIDESAKTVLYDTKIVEVPMTRQFRDDLLVWQKQTLPSAFEETVKAITKENCSKVFLFRLEPSIFCDKDHYQNWHLWPIDPNSGEISVLTLPDDKSWRAQLPGGDPFISDGQIKLC